MSYEPLQNNEPAFYPHNPANPPAQAPFAQSNTGAGTSSGSGAPQYAMPAGYIPPGQPQSGYAYAAPAPGVYQPLTDSVPQGYVAVPVNPSMVQFQGSSNVAYNGLPLPQPGMWLDGLCDCFNDGVTCFLSSLFPWIRLAMTLDRARLMKFWIALCFFAAWYICYVVLESIYISVYKSSATVIWPGMLILAVSVFFILARTHFRMKLREKYSIPGNAFEDCCVHFCCTCCAISQEARHVDRVEMATSIRV